MDAVALVSLDVMMQSQWQGGFCLKHELLPSDVSYAILDRQHI